MGHYDCKSCGSTPYEEHSFDCERFGAGRAPTEGTDMTELEQVALANCRGSWQLGTACGKCPRCEATRPAIAAMTVQAEPVAKLRAEITRLTEALRAADEREKALREVGNPFVFAVKHCKAIGKRPHDFVLTSEFEALAAALKEQPHADA